MCFCFNWNCDEKQTHTTFDYEINIMSKIGSIKCWCTYAQSRAVVSWDSSHEFKESRKILSDQNRPIALAKLKSDVRITLYSQNSRDLWRLQSCSINILKIKSNTERLTRTIRFPFDIFISMMVVMRCAWDHCIWFILRIRWVDIASSAWTRTN